MSGAATSPSLEPQLSELGDGYLYLSSWVGEIDLGTVRYGTVPGTQKR